MKPAILAIALFASSTSLVSAQEEAICMTTVEMEAALVDWYNETPVQEHGEDALVWASGIGGTWTIVTYEPNGTSCTLAQGDDWSPEMSGDMLMAQNDATDDNA